MKKIITLLLLAFALTSGTFAQVRIEEVGTSKSKTVQFMETTGSFLKKETYFVCNFRGLIFNAIIVTDLKSGFKMGCLMMENNGSVILDADELDAAVQSLEYIKDNVLSDNPGKPTEVYYLSRDNVKLGVYSYDTLGLDKDGAKIYEWRIFVRNNNYDLSIKEFNIKHIETFIEYLKKAQVIIAEKTKL